jgi:hypothetical protein
VKHVPMGQDRFSVGPGHGIEPVPGDAPQKLPEGHRRPYKALGGTRVAGRSKARQRGP